MQSFFKLNKDSYASLGEVETHIVFHNSTHLLGALATGREVFENKKYYLPIYCK